MNDATEQVLILNCRLLSLQPPTFFATPFLSQHPFSETAREDVM
jgi:hypothetical protein